MPRQIRPVSPDTLHRDDGPDAGTPLSGEQLELDLPRGGLIYLSLNLSYVMHQGWRLRVWHRHHGDSALCDGWTDYDELSLNEAADVIDALVSPANGPYYRDGSQCRPGIRPGTGQLPALLDVSGGGDDAA